MATALRCLFFPRAAAAIATATAFKPGDNSLIFPPSSKPPLQPLQLSTRLFNATFFSTGRLSLSADWKKPLRPPPVCFSYRYAPDSTLRKKKARKRGGDPSKKRKVKRKGKRSKKSVKVVSLVSTAGTGFFYAKTKSVASKEKLKLLKFDPVVNRHVLFQE